MAADGLTDLRSLTEIIADRANTHENRALECLRNLWELPADDLAREDYRAAAITFGLLAVVDRLGYFQLRARPDPDARPHRGKDVRVKTLALLLLGAVFGIVYASIVWLAGLHPNGGNGVIWIPVLIGTALLVGVFLFILVALARGVTDAE